MTDSAGRSRGHRGEMRWKRPSAVKGSAARNTAGPTHRAQEKVTGHFCLGFHGRPGSWLCSPLCTSGKHTKTERRLLPGEKVQGRQRERGRVGEREPAGGQGVGGW